MELGAGRRSKDDVLDLGVGIRIHRNVGQKVEAGEPIFTVYAKAGAAVNPAPFLATVELRPEPATAGPWLLETVE